MMQRREFITLIGGAAAWPLAARAQQPALPLIGYLNSGAPEASTDVVAAFRKGLSEMGYLEGRNVAIEFRWSRGEADRLPELAADLIRRGVAVIATPNGGPSALAAKALTTTIPIVFSTATDPVQAGLVASLNRPGGNVTGIAWLGIEIQGKQLGLLHELLPRAGRFAVLVNPSFGAIAEPTVKEVQSAASSLGLEVEVLNATTSREIDLAFATLVQKRADGLLFGPSNLFSNRRVQITTLATRHAVPVIYYAREFTAAGGLMSYGASATDQDRQVGIYVGRILKGEKPADLPVIRPTKFEFVINLQTAGTFGIEIPPTLLARADEVIE
jgi:putative ABC transport system substrate-binding protein